jgi:peptidyl-prolyl cis-trans isomerase D
MTMFDLVRNNKKVVQIVLALIVLPFALWGVDSYVRNSGGGANEVASVGKTPISQDEFQRSLSEQQERLRPQVGNNVALLESPEFRRGVLQELINQRLLLLHANKAQMGISNEMLSGFIMSLPSLQVDGKFSRERYEALVAAQNMSVENFEGMLRRDLLTQQVTLPVANAAIAGNLPTDRWLIAQLEEREIAEANLSAERFAGDSKPDQAAVKRYYEENRARFEQPEQVRVEYLVLSQKKLIETVQVSEADIKVAYEANAARYRKPEQRRASHILIRADKNAPAADVKAAEDKAAQLLAQLKANPADFAKLAKQNSQDPGSAANGGDLGFFGRGMMVKPFEEATYALQENQISAVVRSDFGFHIIKLTGIRAEQAQKLEEVRGEIQAELKRQVGTKKYAEAAEGFSNLVYEQADSLKPAAEKYGLTVQMSEWMAKDGQLTPPFTNPKLAQAIYSDDAVKHKRNTEAVEAAPNTLVSARVVEHKPAEVTPLEKVAGVIEKVLGREAALTKAAEAGQAELEKLNRGEKSALSWGSVRSVSRQHAPNLSRDAGEAIFAVDAKKLPAYTGVKTPTGFALYRIDKVKAYEPAAAGEVAPRAQALRQQYNEVLAREDLINWLAALRQQYGVKINSAALERK